MLRAINLIICFSLLAAIPVFASDACLKYEPESVELEGKVKKEVFPGPPNYESIQQGDRPEAYWVLYPPKPVCVRGDPTSDLNSETEDNVTSIQLIIWDYKKFKHLLGKNVVAKGKLMHAISGHHHTSVLLQLESMKAENPGTPY
jgi:hypothetical protein